MQLKSPDKQVLELATEIVMRMNCRNDEATLIRMTWTHVWHHFDVSN